MRLLPAAATFAIAVLAAPAHAELQPGRYSVVTSFATAGNPPRSQTREECLTAEEAAHPGPTLLQEVVNNGSCQVSNQHETADRFSADFSCTVQGRSARGHLDIAFSGNGMNGSITSSVNGGQQTQQAIQTTIAATRVGECQQQAPQQPR